MRRSLVMTVRLGTDDAPGQFVGGAGVRAITSPGFTMSAARYGWHTCSPRSGSPSPGRWARGRSACGGDSAAVVRCSRPPLQFRQVVRMVAGDRKSAHNSATVIFPRHCSLSRISWRRSSANSPYCVPAITPPAAPPRAPGRANMLFFSPILYPKTGKNAIAGVHRPGERKISHSSLDLPISRWYNRTQKMQRRCMKYGNRNLYGNVQEGL